MSDRRIHSETLAGDPIAFAGERERVRQSRRTEAELVDAIPEYEAQQGRPMTPTQRESFARGFFSVEYGDEIRLLVAQGLLDDEDEE